MATSPHTNLHSVTTFYPTHTKPLPIFTVKIPHFKTKHQFQIISNNKKFKRVSFPITNSAFTDSGVPNNESNDNIIKFFDYFQDLVAFIRQVFPGGSWWNLRNGQEAENPTANPITVWIALSRMWNLIGRDKWIVLVAVASLIVAAVSEISMPRILAEAVFSAQREEAMVFHNSSRFLVLLCVTSGIFSGLRSGCFSIANIVLDVYFFDTEAVGGLTSRLTADCQRLSNVIGNDINMILRNSLQGAGAFINLLTLSWPLTLSALLICSFLSIIVSVYGQYQKRASVLTQECNAHANNVAQETLCMMRTVRVYGTEEKELGRYKIWLEKLAFIRIRESMAYGLWNMSFITLYRSTQVMAVLLGGMSIMIGQVSPEQLTKYVLYCEWLIYATWRMVDNLSSLLQSIGATEKVFQLIDLLPSNQFLSEGVKLQRLMGHVQFVNISFHYPSRPTGGGLGALEASVELIGLYCHLICKQVPILNHVCLTIEANEVVAIVGLSGSGKSTFVNLLLRLYEPSDGQIYIDGFPLTDLDIRWLREKIGFVGQEPQLLQMDIKSNIMYGCPKDVKNEDIEWAAKQAYVHEFILSLPCGYETLVDDDLLSGGQKQRIAIARAILRDPAILVLDEATSALDSESEHYVKGVLHALRNDCKTKRTVIVIAHRLSTIKAVDRIVVIDDGRIIEVGNHAELLHKGRLYAKLVKRQTESLT
ncbi:ABC transporter B family member 26, chloroplastic-like isoform X5 [Citrus sinensis]|uniref:ABC transporter B family member 26, chloroplastic-like isoform X5 n=1 Tax=Citrus sinensis TaxID=2711 RepID=UPI002277FB22|nr:ABC transporter B family member 26, chloroplastic-like isoform X5 [Citrus sinensis]